VFEVNVPDNLCLHFEKISVGAQSQGSSRSILDHSLDQLVLLPVWLIDIIRVAVVFRNSKEVCVGETGSCENGVSLSGLTSAP
jgi:hypothetical protein